MTIFSTVLGFDSGDAKDIVLTLIGLVIAYYTRRNNAKVEEVKSAVVATAEAAAVRVEAVRTDTVDAAKSLAAETKGAVKLLAKEAEGHREEIRDALEKSDAVKTAHLNAQDEVLAEISLQNEKIVEHTNGILARVEAAGIAKGRLDERAEESDRRAKASGENQTGEIRIG